MPFADSPDPFAIPAAFVIKTEAGGVFVMKVKLLSSKTEISTGITKPALSWVREFYSLQHAIMCTPCCPRAGPTGGAGLALPACKANLIRATTFFAIG